MLVDLSLNFANTDLRRRKTKVLRCGGLEEEQGTERSVSGQRSTGPRGGRTVRAGGPGRSVPEALTKLSGLGEP